VRGYGWIAGAGRELRGDILPFWLKYAVDDVHYLLPLDAVDDEFGGFRGQITNDLKIDPLRSFACVETRIALIRKNLAALKVYGKLPGRPPAGRVR